jgi:hypothetical protein
MIVLCVNAAESGSFVEGNKVQFNYMTTTTGCTRPNMRLHDLGVGAINLVAAGLLYLLVYLTLIPTVGGCR